MSVAGKIVASFFTKPGLAFPPERMASRARSQNGTERRARCKRARLEKSDTDERRAASEDAAWFDRSALTTLRQVFTCRSLTRNTAGVSTRRSADLSCYASVPAYSS